MKNKGTNFGKLLTVKLILAFMFLMPVGISAQLNPTKLCDASFYFKTDGYKMGYSASNNSSGAEHFWNFGDGTTGRGASGDHTYQNEGVYVICHVVKYSLNSSTNLRGCSDTVCKKVEIKLPCRLKVDWKYEVRGTVAYFYSSAQSTATNLVYKWEFGNGNTSGDADTKFDFQRPGTYKVCLTVASRDGKCRETVCKEVIIKPDPCARLKASYRYKQENDKALFHSTTKGRDLVYEWTINGRKVADKENFRFHFPKPGKYTVCLVVKIKGTRCVDRVCKVIEIKDFCARLQAQFRYQQKGDKAIFHSTTKGRGLVYEWTINGRKVSEKESFRFHFPKPGKYNVCLVVKIRGSHCVSRICKTVVVKDPCERLQAAFRYKVHGHKALFVSTTKGNNLVYEWTINGRSVSEKENFRFNFPKPGKYTVCLIVKMRNGRCVSRTCQVVVINEPPPCRLQANFRAEVHGYVVALHNLSKGEDLTYLWEIDGQKVSRDKDLKVQLRPGKHRVCLTISNNNGRCTETYCTVVEIRKTNTTFSPTRNTGHNLVILDSDETAEAGAPAETTPNPDAAAKVEMTLFPNPAQDVLNLTITGASNATIIISSQSGVIYYNAAHAVVTGEAVSLPISHLPQGYHIAKVLTADGKNSTTLKFYKQ